MEASYTLSYKQFSYLNWEVASLPCQTCLRVEVSYTLSYKQFSYLSQEVMSLPCQIHARDLVKHLVFVEDIRHTGLAEKLEKKQH